MHKFNIKGMDCESCAQLIKMNLEDAGFNDIEVDLSTNSLTVPEAKIKEIEKIKQAVDTAGHYKLIIN